MVTWLQQLEMESLGKFNSTLKGLKTCPAVWGGHGNESQHSFYQWLREGTASTALDICWIEKPGHDYIELDKVLKANAKAQTEALVSRNPEGGYFNAINTLVIDELTPERLGAFMSLYEHKTVMLASLLGINAFDQPGVELGKSLAQKNLM